MLHINIDYNLNIIQNLMGFKAMSMLLYYNVYPWAEKIGPKKWQNIKLLLLSAANNLSRN